MSDSLFPRTMSLAVHELRTPVTVVSGYLRMLLKEQAGPVSDKQRKMLEEAERACGRIGGIVAEMSEMGKLESQQLAFGRTEFDLAALISELAGGMHEGHDRGVEMQVRSTGKPVMVTGDRARVGAAIRALMHASVRERGEPGIVIAAVTTVVATPGSWAVCAIGDDTAVNRLIASASTPPDGFDEWRGGLGLALPVARRVIEALGGAIWSPAGEGARSGAALRLPLSTAS